MFRKLVLLTVSAYWFMGILEASAEGWDTLPVTSSSTQSSTDEISVEESLLSSRKYEDIDEWKLGGELIELLETKKKDDPEVQVLANYLLEKFSSSERYIDRRHYRHIFGPLLRVYPKDHSKIIVIADRMVKLACCYDDELRVEELIGILLDIYDRNHPSIIKMADHLAKIGFDREYPDSKNLALGGLLRLRLYSPIRHDYLANQLATYDFMALQVIWNEDKPENTLSDCPDALDILVTIYGKKDERVLKLANILADQVSVMTETGFKINRSSTIKSLLKIFKKDDERIQKIARKFSEKSFSRLYDMKDVLTPLIMVLGVQDENVRRIAQSFFIEYSKEEKHNLFIIFPVLKSLSQIFGLEDSRVQNLINDLRELSKKEEHLSYLLQTISALSSILGSTHTYVQELIYYHVQRARADDPNSPFTIHDQLLKKESMDAFSNIVDAQVSDITFRINPDWIKKTQEYVHIPFEYATFQAMIHNLKNKITTNELAGKTFAETLHGIDLEEYKDNESFYSGLLDHTAASSSSSSSVESPVHTNTMESFRLRSVLQNILDKYRLSSSVDDLNDGDRTLIQLLMNVHTCPSGQNRGVHMTFYNLGFDRLLTEDETDSKVILDQLYQYIDKELRRQCQLALDRLDVRGIQLSVHDTQYLTTLLSRPLGFLMAGEKPPFDINGNSISPEVRALSKQEGLDKFYQVVTTSKFIEWTQGFFDEIDKKITIGSTPWEKYLVVSATLSNVQPEDAHKKIPLNPRYITFKDPETQMEPNGITAIAAGEMLVRFGIVLGIGE